MNKLQKIGKKVDLGQSMAKKSSSVSSGPKKQIKELKLRKSVADEKLGDQYLVHDINESAYESLNKHKKITKKYTRKNGVDRKKHCTYDLTEDEPRQGRECERSLEQIDEAEEDEGDNESSTERYSEECPVEITKQELSQGGRPESENSCDNISDDKNNDGEVDGDYDLVECDSSGSAEKPHSRRAKRTMPSISVDIEECVDCEEEAPVKRGTQNSQPSKDETKKMVAVSLKNKPVSEKILSIKNEKAKPISQGKGKNAGSNEHQIKTQVEEVVQKDSVKVKTKPLALEVAQFSSQVKSRGRPATKAQKKASDFSQPQPTNGISSNQLLANLLSQAEAFSTVFGCSTSDVIKLLKVHDYDVDKVRTQLMKISLQKASATSLIE
jgi:hypothetical protein